MMLHTASDTTGSGVDEHTIMSIRILRRAGYFIKNVNVCFSKRSKTLEQLAHINIHRDQVQLTANRWCERI